MRFLLLNTASVSSSKKMAFFKRVENVVVSKALILGRQDALFLTQSNDLKSLSDPKILTTARASGDWSSHLLVSMGPLINVTELTSGYPFTVVAFFKVKDYALREVASQTNIDIEARLLGKFQEAIDNGKKDCDNKHGPQQSPCDRKIKYGVFFSYGSNDDIAVVCGTNSLCLASYAICHMRGVSHSDLLSSDDSSRPKFEHFMWDSNCLVAVNLTPDHPTFKSQMDLLAAQIIDKDHTFATVSLASKPGHSPLAIQQFTEKSGQGLIAASDFYSAFNDYGVRDRNLLPIDKALAILANLIEEGDSNKEGGGQHIRQTCTEVCVERPKREYASTRQVSHTRLSVQYNAYLKYLCDELHAGHNTISTLESSFSRIFAVASEDASRSAYAYPEASCYSALVNMHRTFVKQRGKPLFDIDEHILHWVDLMDSCYRDRYRGFGTIGAIANLPILSHQGAFGRTLVVCDFLANTFLWLQDEALRDGLSVRVNNHLPVILSRFSPVEMPSIHLTNMGTVFLDIGWRTVFSPLAVYYLCHESANVFLAGYFGVLGQEKCPIVFDVLADWIALNTVANPTQETLHRYFRSMYDLGIIPDGKNPCSRERLMLLTRLALRFHMLNKLITQKATNSLSLENVLNSEIFELRSEVLIGNLLHIVGAHVLGDENVDALKLTRIKKFETSKLFDLVYPNYLASPSNDKKADEQRFIVKLNAVVSNATKIRGKRSVWEEDQSISKRQAAESVARVCCHIESETDQADDEDQKKILVLMGLRSQIVEPEEFFTWMQKYKEDVADHSDKKRG